MQCVLPNERREQGLKAPNIGDDRDEETATLSVPFAVVRNSSLGGLDVHESDVLGLRSVWFHVYARRSDVQ